MQNYYLKQKLIDILSLHKYSELNKKKFGILVSLLTPRGGKSYTIWRGLTVQKTQKEIS